jgi:FkbM family methyltransferase
MTTLPERINKILPILESIFSQTIKPDLIQINVPKKYIRSKAPIVIPDFLKQNGIFVNRCHDLGPATKLLPTLKSGYDPDDIIITIDDDVIYHEGMIEKFLIKTKQYPDSVLCYRGRKLGKSYNESILYRCNEINGDVDVDLVTGTWGVLYKPRFFNESIFEEQKNPKIFLTDDILISGHLAKYNINRKTIYHMYPMVPQDNHRLNSLWEKNKNGANNNASIKIYEKYIMSTQTKKTGPANKVHDPMYAIPYVYKHITKSKPNGKANPHEYAAMFYCQNPSIDIPIVDLKFQLQHWDKLSNPTIAKVNSICLANGHEQLTLSVEKISDGKRSCKIYDGSTLDSQYDHIGKIIRNYKTYYEHDMLKYLKANYRNSGAIVDLGANIGNHTVFFAKYLKCTEVVAIEPEAKNFSYLENNIKLNGLTNVTAINRAMSLDGRKLKAEICIENMGSCNMVNGGTKKSIDPSFFDEYEKIGFFKIDCEDMSDEIFKAVLPIIKKHQSDVIIEASKQQANEYAKMLGYRVIAQFNATPTFYLKK